MKMYTSYINEYDDAAEIFKKYSTQKEFMDFLLVSSEYTIFFCFYSLYENS